MTSRRCATTEPPDPPGRRAQPQVQRHRERSQQAVAGLDDRPAAVLLIAFLIIPIALTFTLAFTNARAGLPASPASSSGSTTSPGCSSDPTVLEVAAQHR